MTVFPRNNLNPDAVPWGRAIENATTANGRAIEDLQLDLLGENRSTAGQMGSAGRQIELLAEQATELGSRLSTVTNMSSVSVTATSTTAWSSASGTVTLPGVEGGERNAMIIVSAPVSKTNTNMAGPFVTVRFRGVVVFRRAISLAGGIFPPGWGDSLNTSFAASVPSAGGVLEIQVQSQLFVAGTGTATVENPTITTYFVDRS